MTKIHAVQGSHPSTQHVGGQHVGVQMQKMVRQACGIAQCKPAKAAEGMRAMVQSRAGLIPAAAKTHHGRSGATTKQGRK